MKAYRRSKLFTPGFIVSALGAGVSLLLYLMGPANDAALTGATLCLIVWLPALVAHIFLAAAYSREDALRDLIEAALKPQDFDPKSLHYQIEHQAAFRFVDLFRGIEKVCEQARQAALIELTHQAPLNALLAKPTVVLERPTAKTFKVRFDESLSLPTERFWVIRARDNTAFAILRLREARDGREGYVQLEVAGSDENWCKQLLAEIKAESWRHSIYRGRLVQCHANHYGCSLEFKREERISATDIVLDDDLRAILERNIFDLCRRREEFAKHGLPCKKGVLLYGPPGTGKTYTCKYIYSNLKGVTTLVAAGNSLSQVKQICEIARKLQPALVVLEDVDLVFAAREINLYSSALGDLLDEMDGFQSNDAVIFLLTTNAIERLEKAIKDRPGRISQCIYFGHPDEELRRRYLQRYLRGYDAAELNLDEIVEMTKGASQAFLKELIYRAVQIALEDAARVNGRVTLTSADFETALDEMTRFREKSTRAIIGFSTSD